MNEHPEGPLHAERRPQSPRDDFGRLLGRAKDAFLMGFQDGLAYLALFLYALPLASEDSQWWPYAVAQMGLPRYTVSDVWTRIDAVLARGNTWWARCRSARMVFAELAIADLVPLISMCIFPFVVLTAPGKGALDGVDFRQYRLIALVRRSGLRSGLRTWWRDGVAARVAREQAVAWLASEATWARTESGEELVRHYQQEMDPYERLADRHHGLVRKAGYWHARQILRRGGIRLWTRLSHLVFGSVVNWFCFVALLCVLYSGYVEYCAPKSWGEQALSIDRREGVGARAQEQLGRFVIAQFIRVSDDDLRRQSNREVATMLGEMTFRALDPCDRRFKGMGVPPTPPDGKDMLVFQKEWCRQRRDEVLAACRAKPFSFSDLQALERKIADEEDWCSSGASGLLGKARDIGAGAASLVTRIVRLE